MRLRMRAASPSDLTDAAPSASLGAGQPLSSILSPQSSSQPTRAGEPRRTGAATAIEICSPGGSRNWIGSQCRLLPGWCYNGARKGRHAIDAEPV